MQHSYSENKSDNNSFGYILKSSLLQGTIRFKEELSHEANAGLEKILPLLEPVKEKHPGNKHEIEQ